MAEETIEVTIGPDGRVELHVEGVAGMECLTLTEDLVALLGGDVEAQELTAEAYIDAAEEAQQERQWR